MTAGGNQPFRIYERRPCRHTTVWKDAGSRNLDDAVVSWPDAGGFQVHAHQRPSQDQVGGKLLCEALYIHGFRLILRLLRLKPAPQLARGARLSMVGQHPHVLGARADRLVEEAGSAPVAARRRIGNRFPPPPLFLHEPGRFEGTQVETSRLDGCRQTLEIERVRPQTTRRQSVTETRANGFDSPCASTTATV